jgi:hypothetical protein
MNQLDHKAAACAILNSSPFPSSQPFIDNTERVGRAETYKSKVLSYDLCTIGLLSLPVIPVA